ncbi:helix-turn-helix domain-containing protein [Streptomyces melanogenes]|uniref:helix-turn-helix domain-containing protein n=1 Tax=Streptomyces melanogenes TaxID=67326 RepID=UPI0037B44B29
MTAAIAHSELQTFLRRCRERVGISQATLAERLHLSPRGYWNLERGLIQNPSAEVLDSLAAILRLGARERWTLYMLATRHEPPPLDGVALEGASAFSELLSVQQCPAAIVDSAWQIVACNHSYRELPFDMEGNDRGNLLHHLLLTPHVRDTLLGSWDMSWAVPLLGELRTTCEVHPGTAWPKRMLLHVGRDSRLRRAWRRLDFSPPPRPAAARPFHHPLWGPQVTVLETVPRYMAGYKIVSLVPGGSPEGPGEAPLSSGLSGEAVE